MSQNGKISSVIKRLVDRKYTDQASLTRFHCMMADALHSLTKKYVTTGSASLKWNSDAHGDGNWWRDDRLTSSCGKTNGKLDFY